MRTEGAQVASGAAPADEKTVPTVPLDVASQAAALAALADPAPETGVAAPKVASAAPKKVPFGGLPRQRPAARGGPNVPLVFELRH